MGDMSAWLQKACSWLTVSSGSVWKVMLIFNMHSTSAIFISVSCGLIFLAYKELWEHFFWKCQIYIRFFFPLDFYGCICVTSEMCWMVRKVTDFILSPDAMFWISYWFHIKSRKFNLSLTCWDYTLGCASTG